MLEQLIALLVMFFLMALTHILPVGAFEDNSIRAATALGFIIPTAYIIGSVLHRFKLPKITGYMIVGVLAGPYVLDFLTEPIVHDLTLIDQVALSLIAFSAGRKLKISMLRKRAKPILYITLARTIVCVTLGFGFTYLIGPHFFAFLKGQPQSIIVVVAIFFGIFSLATSPVLTIAVIEETKSEGPITDTILGSVVLADLIIIMLAAIAVSLSKAILSNAGIDAVVFGRLSLELVGSFLMGILCGGGIALYLHYVKEQSAFFVLAAAFICTQIANVFHLDALLLCLSAGFVIENVFHKGNDFLAAISKSTPLIYVIFFPITAATLNLHAIQMTWYVILTLLLLRKISVFTSVYLGSKLSEDNPGMRRWGWLAFFHQAGVTLALAVIIDRSFPEFGGYVKAVALGMVACTDFYGPALFKFALWKVGEAKVV
ncbi:MAG: hypothetical protein D6675_00465 [Gemmatimonadetes bacterium]|nr:MAG: hypothetical protein D6675_00465 [Gemmatimonadota bacterium]